MRDLADFLSQSEFQKFAEKHEHKTPWLTHTLICALHSIPLSFVLVANDFTYQRQVEHNTNIEVSAIQKCWDIYENIKADFTLSLASSTPRAFTIPPGSYKHKTSENVEKNHVERDSHNSDRNNKRPIVSDKRGWLIADGNFNFPRTLSVTPCKKFSCEDRECTYGRRCSFFHGRFPQNYKKPDRTSIADWVKTTRNVKYSGQVDMSKLERSFNETNDGENNSANTDTTTANGVASISSQT